MQKFIEEIYRLKYKIYNCTKIILGNLGTMQVLSRFGDNFKTFSDQNLPFDSVFGTMNFHL